MMGRDGTRHNFNQTEHVQFKADGTLLVVEGKKVHDTFAVFSYNKEKKEYSFQLWMANGMNGSFKAELKGDTLIWYPRENMQYSNWLNEKGQWYEKGKMNREGEWFQFFEMTLDKQ